MRPFSSFSAVVLLTFGWANFGQAAQSASSKGCGTPLPKNVTPGGPSTNISIASHKIERSYLLHLPKGYDNTKAAPVYFSFHGANRNASEQEGLSQFSNPSFNPNGIAVYPQGLYDRWLSNPADEVAHFSPNDLDFMIDLLDELESKLCVDTNQMYASGKSNGGGFSNVIACNSTVGPRFAAFASVSGAYYNDTLVTGIGPCNNTGTKHTPFVEFHGLIDCTAPYDGKEGSTPKHTQIGVPGFLEIWLKNNGCSTNAKPASNITAFSNYTNIESWDCSGKQGVVQHYREQKLGHIWPSTLPNDDCMKIKGSCVDEPACPLGKSPNGYYAFNATSEIFKFFGKNVLPSSRA